jgi:hypothetical protein
LLIAFCKAYVAAFKPRSFTKADFNQLHDRMADLWLMDPASLIVLSVDLPPTPPPAAAVLDVHAVRVEAQKEVNQLLQQVVADKAAQIKHGSKVSFRDLGRMRSAFTGLRTAAGVRIVPPIPSRGRVTAATSMLLESDVIQKMEICETDGLHWARMPLRDCMRIFWTVCCWFFAYFL